MAQVFKYYDLKPLEGKKKSNISDTLNDNNIIMITFLLKQDLLKC